MINSAAHITGGGLIENITRSVPNNLCVNIDLSKIKPKKIFRWLKKKNISDLEMLKTFNCGIGFYVFVRGIIRNKPLNIAIMGSTKSKILLGFGLSSYLLSMWISNTATTLMMLPMAISIIQAQQESEESNRFSLLHTNYNNNLYQDWDCNIHKSGNINATYL